MKQLYSFHRVAQLTLLAADDRYRHWNGAYCILMVAEGKGELLIDGTPAILHPGALFFCNPDRLLEIKAAAHQDLVIYMVFFHIFSPCHIPGEHRFTASSGLPGWRMASGLSPRTFALAAWCMS